MTSLMYDNFTADEGHNAANLRPGTLVYLWRPGEDKDRERALVQVKKATQHMIRGIDRRDGARGDYEVSTDVPPGLRWTWEVAGIPLRNTVTADGVERIEGGSMTLEERVRLVCGSPGASITVRLKNGDALPRVVLSKLIMGQDDDWEAEWCVFIGDRDAAGGIAHVVRAEEIAGFSRDVDA